MEWHKSQFGGHPAAGRDTLWDAGEEDADPPRLQRARFQFISCLFVLLKRKSPVSTGADEPGTAAFAG